MPAASSNSRRVWVTQSTFSTKQKLASSSRRRHSPNIATNLGNKNATVLEQIECARWSWCWKPTAVDWLKSAPCNGEKKGTLCQYQHLNNPPDAWPRLRSRPAHLLRDLNTIAMVVDHPLIRLISVHKPGISSFLPSQDSWCSALHKRTITVKLPFMIFMLGDPGGESFIWIYRCSACWYCNIYCNDYCTDGYWNIERESRNMIQLKYSTRFSDGSKPNVTHGQSSLLPGPPRPLFDHASDSITT